MPTSSALPRGLTMLNGRPSPGRADLSGNISTPWIRLPGARPATIPKFISRSDPAAQWTGAHKGHAFFAYADNYLIDLKAAIIVDVEAIRVSRPAEVAAAKTMLDRTEACFG